MNRKTLSIVSIVMVLALAGGGYYYWKTKMQKAPEISKPAAQQAAEDIQKAIASVSADVGNNVSPDVTTPVVSPTQTDANPYNKTNPFSNLKTNPFQ